jgi:prepilin-type N-terminal cleavage/methylation domain-containing protein
MKKGFTLIELLVVIGIMGVLAAVGVASYNTIGDRSKAQQAAQLIATHFRAAQKDADSNIGASLCLGTTYQGVRAAVVDVSGEKKITISAVCSGVAQGIRTVEFKLQRGITVSLGFVTFKPLSQGIAEFPTPTFTVQSGSYPFTITFTVAGGINVQ